MHISPPNQLSDPRKTWFKGERICAGPPGHWLIGMRSRDRSLRVRTATTALPLHWKVAQGMITALHADPYTERAFKTHVKGEQMVMSIREH